ncbi:alpha/beta-hydrolase [Exidia glandulosa HHB12029]|uniref:Alpha/beta-hydrolase n=1 Tax=Exidia glandulosa HHB12029 TaxID=1314781 RepID=A0A165ZG67_EXIGL|nr:alpha/beta-hydrolase [Exidia glandulosa HHB12029]
MPYALTADVGVKVGPLLLETAFRHFLSSKHGSDEFKAKDELLYDEAFNIVKVSKKPAITLVRTEVEDLQQFSNARIPVPPWIHAPRVLIPMSCCNTAANHLIEVLGGPEMCQRLVGGTKWWQVRGVQGVDGQWIAARKDWQEAKRRRKEYEAKHKSPPPPDMDPNITHEYTADMDQMRCLLFAHGGGYFFGSIDQERYCMQRYARKMKGRVFAVGYRLAPQYPFPCALQDTLAAYLYLIDPPPGAKHLPVPPSMIMLGGSSAGGGMMIALLQVIRDAGLPLPAGAVLISPWCDLTHSFDSIHENTATDIIPSTGLSFLKPSTLWPPPTEEAQDAVRKGLRERIKRLVHHDSHTPSESDTGTPAASRMHLHEPARGARELRHAQSATALHIAPDDKQRVAGQAPHAPEDDHEAIDVMVDGRKVKVDTQIHLYAPNSLIKHPLISPVMSYLGGLPPLLVIASDKEVLRDEVIYMAHRAAHPERYPIKDEIRQMYPKLDGIESKYGPTKVHLQVYDDVCHVLPLFSFTTPAKFCYRAIATFCKWVTPERSSTTSPTMDSFPSPPATPLMTDTFVLTPEKVETPTSEQVSELGELASGSSTSAATDASSTAERPKGKRLASLNAGIFRRRSLLGAPQARRSVSLVATSRHSLHEQREQEREDSGDVAGKRFGAYGHAKEPGMAGDPAVYHNREGSDSPYVDNMIRERVSTLGVIRPLEPESEVPALCKPEERVGIISEASAKRYLEARITFDKKFARTSKNIERSRSKHLSKAHKEGHRVMEQLARAPVETLSLGSVSPWYLDPSEVPPSSSLVARRDTAEARRLGMIADYSLSQEETRLSGNSLWSAVANFLSTTPENEKKKTKAAPQQADPSPSHTATDGAHNGVANGTAVSDAQHPTNGVSTEQETAQATVKKRRSSILVVKDFLSRKSTIKPSTSA